MFHSSDGTPPSLAKKMALGIVAGGSGAVVGTPAEIALIRMTADGRLPSESRRGYKNVFDALFRITREEGIATLWRVCLITLNHVYKWEQECIMRSALKESSLLTRLSLYTPDIVVTALVIKLVTFSFLFIKFFVFFLIRSCFMN